MQRGTPLDITVDLDMSDYGYTDEQLRSYHSHIQLFFGHADQILLCPGSRIPAVDLLVIAPDPLRDRNFYTLVTRGMGSCITPARDHESAGMPGRVELVMFVAPTWQPPRHSEDICPENFWPAAAMIRLAHMPLLTGQRMGPDCIFDNGEPLYEHSPYEGLAVRPLSDSCGPEAAVWTMPDLQQVQLLEATPLTRDEMDYGRSRGMTSLYHKLGWRGHFTVALRSSCFDRSRDYFDQVFCDSRWYLRFMQRNRLESAEHAAWLPGAWYLRFLAEQNLLSTRFFKEFPELQPYADGEAEDFDFLTFFRDTLSGCLDRRFLNAPGWHFTERYFATEDFPCFHGDLLDLQVRHFGLPLRGGLHFAPPRDLSSHKELELWLDLRSVLSARLRLLREEIYFDRSYDRIMAQCLTALVSSSCWFYPPVPEPHALLAHLRHGIRKALAGEGCTVLLEVSPDMVKRLTCSRLSGVVMARRDWMSLDTRVSLSWRRRSAQRTVDEIIVASAFHAWCDDSYDRSRTYPALDTRSERHVLTLLKKASFSSPAAAMALTQLTALYLKNSPAAAAPSAPPSPAGAAATSPHAAAAADGSPADGASDGIGAVSPAQSGMEGRVGADAYVKRRYGPDERGRISRTALHRMLVTMSSQAMSDDFMNLHSIWHDGHEVSRPLLLCELPAVNPVDAISWLPYMMEVPGLSIHNAMEIFARWYEDLGAIPVVLRAHSIEFLVPEALKARQAQRLVYELMALCPKLRLLLDMKICTISDLQDKIKGSFSFTVDWYPVDPSPYSPWGW